MPTWMITGSRRGHPQAETVLEYMRGIEEPSCVVVGDASGVDKQAAAWARRHAIIVAKFKANWKELGAKAGPERNAQMVEFAQRCEDTAWFLGFPDSDDEWQGRCFDGLTVAVGALVSGWIAHMVMAAP